jgi:tetratricopeptide (TPR) repeat protein
MKKTITILLVSLMSMAGIKAQTIQEGINHLYAERNKSAKETFEKLVAANPNNLDAVYWLGQAYIAMNNVAAARDLYSKTLNANGNAPLILAGKGHVELIDGKKDEARQLFESAITVSSGKKGPDPVILNAIGRANVDAKDGDVAYAIEKLKLAVDKDPKNADIFLNLGDAYRKAHEGGQAVVNYDRAIQANPNLARAAYRKGMIYYTQKNWELFEQLMKQSVTMDPKFAPAYYELYYYHLLNKQDFNTAQEYASKYGSTAEQDPQNDYLRIQTLWAKKNFDEAITGAKALAAAAGEQTKPRVYKLLADAYVGKGDTAGAKQYIDKYFAIAKEEEINPTDYILRGVIYGSTSGDDNIIFDSYVKAAQMDSVYSSKMETLQKGVEYFAKKGRKIKEAEMRMVVLKNKKTQNPSDYFFIGLPFYQGGDYKRADSLFKLYTAAFPDSLFGHYWGARANLAMDTTLSQEPYLTNMVNGFRRTLEIAVNNKDRFKQQAVAASSFLAAIYNNTKKDKDSAIYFVQRGLEVDPTNTSLQGLLQQLQKAPTKPPAKNTSGKPTGAIKRSASAKPLAIKPAKKAVAKL